MRALVLIALALMGGSTAFAQSANLTGEAVVLRALDKVTAKTEDFTVAVGDSLTFGSLRVDVKHCEKRPPEDIPETYAFLQIFDTRITVDADTKPADGRDPSRVFSGWMMSSKPAISALDHRVYDVWVLGCKTKPRPNEGALELRP